MASIKMQLFSWASSLFPTINLTCFSSLLLSQFLLFRWPTSTNMYFLFMTAWFVHQIYVNNIYFFLSTKYLYRNFHLYTKSIFSVFFFQCFNPTLCIPIQDKYVFHNIGEENTRHSHYEFSASKYSYFLIHSFDFGFYSLHTE